MSCMEEMLACIWPVCDTTISFLTFPFLFHDSRHWRAMLASPFGATSHLQSLAPRPLPHHRALGPQRRQPVPQRGLNTQTLPARSCGARRVASFPRQVLVLLGWVLIMRRESAGRSHHPRLRIGTTVCMLLILHCAHVSEHNSVIYTRTCCSIVSLFIMFCA